MKSENKFEQIERYLDGSMSGAELMSFKKTLSEDEELRQAVDFQRNMETVLARKPEDSLRKNLDMLNKKYAQTLPRNTKKWWLGIILVAIIGVAFWLFQDNANQVVSPIIEKSNQEIKTSAPVIESSKELPETPIEKSKEAEIETPEIPKKNTNQKNVKQETPPKQKIKPAPIAANFAPNEILENRLGNLRGGKLEIQNFKGDFRLKNGKVNFAMQGVFSDDTKEKEVEYISMYIFSNKKSDYEEFKAVYADDLNFEKSPDGYAFNLSEILEMKAGLYYVQIENEAGEILFLGKFLVEE